MEIYNSLNNKIEKFKSIEENKISMYVCGPTVYNYIHIGNARPLIVFDTLARYFKSLNYEINFVQNFTDIDDKIIIKSLEENITFLELTDKYIKAFMEDIKELNILNEVKRPKVSDNIDEIISMIEELIKKDYAYENQGDVFFRVKKYKDYGKLSNQKLEDLEIGIRVDKDEKKKEGLDFVLWKKKKEGEPYWISPWSEGRPGWHIECSALSKKFLGKNFDIHGGGIDLIFPHHENEIAQSRCSCSENKFANYWMHNGYLEIDGEKMSKSLGNFKLVRDVVKEYSGNVLRFFMLSTHYRKPINFSIEALETSKKTLENLFENMFRYEIEEKNDSFNSNNIELLNKFKIEFKNAMEDDLNTPLAISTIHNLVKNLNKEISKNGYTKELVEIVEYVKNVFENILGVKVMKKENNNLEDKLIELLNNIREEARNNKNYALSDMIRDELNKLGIKISDRKVK